MVLKTLATNMPGMGRFMVPKLDAPDHLRQHIYTRLIHQCGKMKNSDVLILAENIAFQLRIRYGAALANNLERISIPVTHLWVGSHIEEKGRLISVVVQSEGEEGRGHRAPGQTHAVIVQAKADKGESVVEALEKKVAIMAEEDIRNIPRHRTVSMNALPLRE